MMGSPSFHFTLSVTFPPAIVHLRIQGSDGTLQHVHGRQSQPGEWDCLCSLSMTTFHKTLPSVPDHDSV